MKIRQESLQVDWRFAFLLSCCFAAPAIAQNFEKVNVFTSGTEGYNIYRIPAIVKAGNGDLLAFAEARAGGDASEIDLVMKRSVDGGHTWSGLQIVQENDNYRSWDGLPANNVTVGNPAPVVDLLNPTHPGRILLPFTLENDRAFVTYSDDHGATWHTDSNGRAIEITKDVKLPNWGWYAFGPVHSIQMKHGPTAGRLIIPTDHRLAGQLGAHVVYSDDHGQTWELGAVDNSYDDGNDQDGTPFVDDLRAGETTVVELNDGRLFFNTRDGNGSAPGTRGDAYSSDGGETFDVSGDPTYRYFVPSDPLLDPPVVQSSLLRAASTLDGDDLDLILFSGPDSNGPNGPGRDDLRVRYSLNETKTWNDGILIHEGPAAYSDLVRLGQYEYGVLFETGASLYQKIDFAFFSKTDLIDVPGDLDQDGDIDEDDINFFISAYDTDISLPNVPIEFIRADLDADVDVDLTDFVLFNEAYKKFNGVTANFSHFVPEPSCYILTFGYGICLHLLMTHY